MAWLWIFGWFLAASAFLPALLLVGIGLGSIIYSLWLRREVHRFEAETIRAELVAHVNASPEIQAVILVAELEEFLESQP